MGEANRGEVWLVDLGYAAKVRPGLVRGEHPFAGHRPSLDDHHPPHDQPEGDAIRGGDFDADPTLPRLRWTGSDIDLTQAKLIRKLGDPKADQLAQVEDAARTWLGL